MDYVGDWVMVGGGLNFFCGRFVLCRLPKVGSREQILYEKFLMQGGEILHICLTAN